MSGLENDLIPYGMALGNRAHLSGLNIVGLQRRGFQRDQIHILRRAYRLLFAAEGTLMERVDDVAQTYAEAIIALRFYVFYMICVAIGGAFILGIQRVTATSFARQFTAIILLGLVLTYIGVTRSATANFERYGNLQQLQASRKDLARSAESGFGRDVDVSSTSGAISTIPVGMLYLLFAPFPWQITSLRQSITLPEMIIWWASFPLLVLGLWFAIKYRLRMISPILIFTVMLTLAYSVFQGNVGTAYRQRAQLLVFYFIFVAVGFVLMKEKREERKRRIQEARTRL
jgi:hypothetical protein